MAGSYLERLRAELDEISDGFRNIIRGSTIRNVNPNRPGDSVIFIGAADWGWGPSDAEATAARMQLLEQYRAWFVRLALLFRHPTPDVATKLKDTNEFVESWLLRPDAWDWSIPSTVAKAEELGDKRIAVFIELLDLAAHSGGADLRVVPDTSALMRNPDLGSYQRAFGREPFTVHLMPPVLAELDDLKDRGKTQDVRDSAQAVVRRIKGLRDKGSLAVGVKQTKSVTVKTEAREVDAKEVLEWLDPAVPDDRLTACALRLQSDHPSGRVVLVTSDLNLQTKADAAGLPYIETPPTTESLQAKLTARVIPGKRNERSARLELSNEGRSVAKHITYSVQPPDSSEGGIRVTAGPWTVDELGAGKTADPVILAMWPDPAVLRVEWTDATGARQEVKRLDFPPA